MDTRLPIRHRCKGRVSWGVALVACWLLLVATAGCSEKGKALGAIRDSFARQDYEETILLCQHALRKNINNSEVYYYYGISLLELGRDYEAFRRFEDAVAADSSAGTMIAEQLRDEGRAAYAKGQGGRAASRLRFAADLDEDLEFGGFQYLIADAYFADHDFAKAAPMYRAAIAERPDTAVAESAYFNLAECYMALGDSVQAGEALDNLLERFPKGRMAGRAEWKLVNLLYEHAQSEYARGDYERVVEGINTLLTRATNTSLVQRARFLLGEAYERLEDYPSAYDQYKTIIEQDRGASGRIVERAHEKINALRDSGLL